MRESETGDNGESTLEDADFSQERALIIRNAVMGAASSSANPDVETGVSTAPELARAQSDPMQKCSVSIDSGGPKHSGTAVEEKEEPEAAPEELIDHAATLEEAVTAPPLEPVPRQLIHRMARNWIRRFPWKRVCGESVQW